MKKAEGEEKTERHHSKFLVRHSTFIHFLGAGSFYIDHLTLRIEDGSFGFESMNNEKW